MKNLKKEQKGITLIALVITIIVLLILAGVTIAMLTGENSILNRSTEAVWVYDITEGKDQVGIAWNAAYTEYLAKYYTNSLGSGEDLKSIFVKEFNTIKNGAKYTASINNEVTKVTVTSNSDKNHSEEATITITAPGGAGAIQEGSIGTWMVAGESSSGGDTPVTPEPEVATIKSVTELREGDAVMYTDANGNEIPCVVLYDSTGSNGIQVISADTVGSNIELGNGTGSGDCSRESAHFAIAKASYNTAIALLNVAAQSYMNTDLSPTDGARCVGSSPSETPVTSEDNTNNQFKSSSSNNTYATNEDYLQMGKSNINCNNISKVYWLASRWGGTEKIGKMNLTHYDIRIVTINGEFNSRACCQVDGGGEGSYSSAYGLRPVFVIKPDIYFMVENGKKILVQ